MHAQSNAVVPMSRLGASAAQARTVERAVPQHIVDSFTVGGRSLGRKLSTYKHNSPSLQADPTQTRARKRREVKGATMAMRQLQGLLDNAKREARAAPVPH